MLQKSDLPASLRGTPTRMLSAGKIGEAVMCMNHFQASDIQKTRQENMLTHTIGFHILSVLLNIIGEQEQNLYTVGITFRVYTMLVFLTVLLISVAALLVFCLIWLVL